MNGLANSLSELNTKISSIEDNLQSQTKELDSKGIKWFEYDAKKERLVNCGASNKILKINVGGKVFSLTLLTILSNPDCLLFNLIMTDQWDYSEELYVDRSYTHFHLIASYLRNTKISVDSINHEELPSILREAEFFHIAPLIDLLKVLSARIYFLSFEFSGEYMSGQTVIGTNNIADINDNTERSCTKGICTNNPGWIIFELNKEIEIQSIEIGGYSGNTNTFSTSNGSGATIRTSVEKVNWTTVGTINSQFTSGPYIHSLTSSRAKYIKIEHNGNIGIGYFRVIDK